MGKGTFFTPSPTPVSNEAYNAVTWNGVTAIAPSKNAVRDEIEDLIIGALDLGQDVVTLASYDDLADAVDTIGDTDPTILQIPGDTTVDDNLTVTNNIALELIGTSQISIASGKVLTIENGEQFIAPILQVFTGDGTVAWTNTMPSVMYPEWWGAVGDNSTDCLDAFNACLASLQSPSSLTGVYLGAQIQLAAGGTYYLSDTLNIRRPVLICSPTTGDYNESPTYMRFPAATTGVIVQGHSTFDGVSSATQTGAMSELRGFTVQAAASPNNTICSTSGLNITLTGGSITAVSRMGNNAQTLVAITPGSTITLNGREYVITEALSATSTATVPIQAPRVYISAVGTNVVTVGDFSAFPSNNDWAGQTIEIDGTNYTITSNTTTTITLGATVATGLYTGTITTGLKVMAGQNARLNIFHGIEPKALTKLSNMRIYGFSGNGVNVDSYQYPTSALGTEPNANNSYFYRVNCDFNKGSGWTFWGINSNNIETHSINAENNAGWGFCELGTLGANHYSFHNAYNYQGAFQFSSAGANNLMNCYTEGGQPSALIGQNTVLVGGNIASGIDYYYGYGTKFEAEGGLFTTQSGLSVKKYVATYLTISNPKSVLAQLGSINQPQQIMAWGAGEDVVNTNAGYPVTNPNTPCYFLSYAYNNAGWFNIGYGANVTATNDMISMSGSVASAGAGKLAFPTGFRTALTDPTITRVIKGSVTVNPTSINATTVATQTFTLTGAVVGDSLILNAPTAGIDAGMLICQAWVSASNTISITFFNTTVGSIDIASATWFYTLIR